MIVIIDYGVGNLGSVKNALDALGFENKISSNREEILSADKIILPGVGAFADAMASFKALKLDKVLKEYMELKRPILGICVGMQMLFESSDEYGYHEGLKVFKGKVIPFDGSKDKIPHMGWNNLRVVKEHPILKGVENEFVYFVHSYHIESSEHTLATSFYAGVEFPCVIGNDFIYATQFHPEKSGKIGLKILKNFGDLS